MKKFGMFLLAALALVPYPALAQDNSNGDTIYDTTNGVVYERSGNLVYGGDGSIYDREAGTGNPLYASNSAIFEQGNNASNFIYGSDGSVYARENPAPQANADEYNDLMNGPDGTIIQENAIGNDEIACQRVGSVVYCNR